MAPLCPLPPPTEKPAVLRIDWRGTPLGCAERPAYARPAGAPGTPSRPGPRLLPCRVRVAPPATDYPRPSAPALPAGQKARPPRDGSRDAEGEFGPYDGGSDAGAAGGTDADDCGGGGMQTCYLDFSAVPCGLLGSL